MGNSVLKMKNSNSTKFDWTKIHLIYFVLAAFDLLAIASGLGLSEWSKRAHEQTINRLDQINYLRDAGANIEDLAIQLNATAENIFANKNTEKAKAEISTIQKALDTAFDEVAFAENIRLTFASDAAPQTSGDPMEAIKKNLSALNPELIESFEEAEDRSKDNLREMLAVVNVAQLNMGFSSGVEIADYKEKMQKAFKATLNDALNTNKTLNLAMHSTVQISEDILNKSTWLQYLIGGAIFVMIVLACAYAFFVGKVLRSKFMELQSAHKESIEQGALIAEINNDVSTLNKELDAKMKALVQAQDELIKKGRMEQLGHLTATVAHELRNPLGAVRTSSFLLERKLKDKGLNVESQLQRIANGVTRCDDIITQLLDFSRTSKLYCEESNLDQWLVKVLEDAALQIPNTVKLTCELGLNDQKVPFDGARLQRAIINLLSNASEAMVGNGKDNAKSATLEPMISISTSIVDDMVAICVSDNGPGMTAEILGKIREPLFTTKSFGTGLGVPAVEQIAHQHGGRLDVTSVVGKGSSFTLVVPKNAVVSEAA
jgi:signal transduction histidine kinase